MSAERIPGAGLAFMKTLRTALALVLGLAGVGLTVPISAHAALSGVTVIASPAGGGALIPGTDLTVQATITNSTASPVDGATATLFLNRTDVGSVSDLAGFFETDGSDNLGAALTSVATPFIPAGGDVVVSLAASAAALNLGAAWGPREFTVQVTSGGAQLGESRGAIVWQPSAPENTESVLLAMPLSVPTNFTGLLTSDELSTLTAPTGLLSRELDAAFARNIAIGVDPMILASIGVLGTGAPATATAWLERLKRAPNDTFALEYNDADTAALSQAGASATMTPQNFTFAIDPKLFAPASPQQTPVPSSSRTTTPQPTAQSNPSDLPPLPTTKELLTFPYTASNVAWPADGTVTGGDLSFITKAGFRTTILSSSNVVVSGSSDGPLASVDNTAVLVSDDTLSSLLRSAVEAPSEVQWQAAIARLTAALAAANISGLSTSRTVFATLDRGWAVNGTRLAETLDAISSLRLPWVVASSLAQATSSTTSTASIVNKPESKERLAAVRSMLQAEDTEAEFASVTKDPTSITAQRRLALLAVLSTYWVQYPQDWRAQVSTYLADSAKLVSSVEAVPTTSVFNLYTNRTSLPIPVRNDLAVPVTVVLHIRLSNSVLAVKDHDVTVTIEPLSRTTVSIPVQAVANGQVTAFVSLRSKTGVAVGTDQSYQLNVQAAWETIGTLLVVVLVVALFAFGLARNIIKRRQGRMVKENAGTEGTDA